MQALLPRTARKMHAKRGNVQSHAPAEKFDEAAPRRTRPAPRDRNSRLRLLEVAWPFAAQHATVWPRPVHQCPLQLRRRNNGTRHTSLPYTPLVPPPLLPFQIRTDSSYRRPRARGAGAEHCWAAPAISDVRCELKPRHRSRDESAIGLYVGHLYV